MKKNNIFFIILGMMSAALAYTATDIYVPALPAIQHFFSTSIHATQYTLSAYLFGLAVAQIAAGPIVDHVGYRKIFLYSILGFILASAICFFSNDITILIATRAFQAIFAGSVGITARASFIRRFTAEQTRHIFTTVSPFIILSAVISPLIGGYIVYYINWQCIFLFLIFYGVALLWMAYCHFYVNEEKPHNSSMNIAFIIKNYIFILKNKEFLQCVIINAIYLAVLFSYLTVAPFIYHAAGYTANEIGLTFIPIAFAFLLASQLIRFLQKYLNMTQFVLLAFILILFGLIVMAIPAFDHTFGLIPMIIGMSIAVFGMGFSNPVAFGKGVTLFPERSGSASSLLTALPFIASTLLTIIVHPICGTHLGLLVLFLAIISTICVSGYLLLEIKK